MIEKRLEKILKACLEGATVTKEDCIYLLSFSETSFETGLIKAVADGSFKKESRKFRFDFGSNWT
ncbi:hypothetical protein AZF37_09485 [endosymbiont 'TC1' of Trimyema compressum]|uniref:hypothetical protein n=1 Tax=endosymbiont 'TC1' of Trimyema compressum TaxID=243899 RepID=UPI0007F1154B|nr:hypothetical protein [endosymbiont 'TC1' of Trimyema compressum]AMP21349.1 hypothetical protein AZF37_09485 [endosymbiont 'TC1' of Trimyema compressum]